MGRNPYFILESGNKRLPLETTVKESGLIKLWSYFLGITWLSLWRKNFDEVLLCFQETIPKVIKVAEIMEGEYLVPRFHISSAQRVPEPDPLPGISFDTRPDPIQF